MMRRYILNVIEEVKRSYYLDVDEEKYNNLNNLSEEDLEDYIYYNGDIFDEDCIDTCYMNKSVETIE